MKKTGPEAPKIRRDGTARRKLDIGAQSLRLAFSDRTYVMGVLNVTPDSFSDGGKFFDKDSAMRHALKMREDGADIIDIGGESTRPGAAEDLSVKVELDRVIPVVESISKRIDIPISVDTRKAQVAREAVRAGASIINDVSGLKHDRQMASVAADSGAILIVMHMKGSPRDMQKDPIYRDVVSEIIMGLRQSLAIAKEAGVAQEKIVVDPGIGFGKTVEHNLEILNRLDEFKVLNCPICVGASRKSFIGKVLNIDDARNRLAGTIAACAVAVTKGANLLRVHDVKEARDAGRIVDSILKERIV